MVLQVTLPRFSQEPFGPKVNGVAQFPLPAGGACKTPTIPPMLPLPALTPLERCSIPLSEVAFLPASRPELHYMTLLLHWVAGQERPKGSKPPRSLLLGRGTSPNNTRAFCYARNAGVCLLIRPAWRMGDR